MSSHAEQPGLDGRIQRYGKRGGHAETIRNIFWQPLGVGPVSASNAACKHVRWAQFFPGGKARCLDCLKWLTGDSDDA